MLYLNRLLPLRLLVLALLTFGLAACATLDRSPSEDPQIRKSPNDPREYAFLTLPNKMRVVLISDLESDKAAAALAVYRGSYHEPDEHPGLAHFLEHMLFIGTEKYPETDAFQTYITANGGGSNAYTASDHTNYFFEIAPGAFAEGLDRFAQFFVRKP